MTRPTPEEDGGDQVLYLLVRYLLALDDGDWLASEVAGRIRAVVENDAPQAAREGMHVVGRLSVLLDRIGRPELRLPCLRWMLRQPGGDSWAEYCFDLAADLSPDQVVREIIAVMDRFENDEYLPYVLSNGVGGAEDPELIGPLLDLRRTAEAAGDTFAAEAAWSVAVLISENSDARLFPDGRVTLPVSPPA